MSEGSFWRSRLAGEALGILSFLAGALAALALASYDPRDPNLFSFTLGGPAAAPSNWIGGAGASLATALYAGVGLAAWAIPVVLALWGWRRFWQSPLENRGSKAAGLAILFLSVPALFALTLGRRFLFGEEMETGGAVGKGIGGAAHRSLGATGAILVMATLALLAIALATQVSLADVALALRVRFAGLYSRLTVNWVRRRDKRTKERLRRTVVARHLDKARKEGVSLEEVPFARDDGPPVLREVPGPGKFSITKTTAAPKRDASPAALPVSPVPAARKKADAQKSLPLTIEGYTYPPVSLLERRETAGVVDKKVLADTGRHIAAKCLEFGVEGEITEYHPGPVVTTYEFRPAAGIKVQQVMGLSEDLALSLSAESIRIERLPGRASVGIEVPNPGGGEIISLRDVVESEKFTRSPSLLTIALGKDIHGSRSWTTCGPCRTC